MLIVLNGPPAVGKSTLGRMFVDDHPLALLIDVDELRGWLGAWRQEREIAGLRARGLAAALARDHLRAGHDVVVAQLYGRANHLDALQAAAAEVGASYREILLMADLESTLERFRERGGPRFEELDPGSGGLETIAELHSRVESLVRHRPQATVVASTRGDVAATYRAVLNTLNAQP